MRIKKGEYIVKVLGHRKESRRNQVIYIYIYIVNIYRTKSSLLINLPPMQNSTWEVLLIIELWALENKAAIDIRGPNLKEVVVKLKIEQRLLNKMERQEVKEESGDDNNPELLDFVIESQKREVKLVLEGSKKGESDKCVRKENEKGMRANGGFMRIEKEKQTQIEEESRSNSWSSDILKIKG